MSLKDVEIRSLKKLCAAGLEKQALKYVLNRGGVAPTLALLKFGMGLAEQLKRSRDHEALASAAIQHFPNNSAGYIQLTRLLASRGEHGKARSVLYSAPQHRNMGRVFRQVREDVESSNWGELGTDVPDFLPIPLDMESRSTSGQKFEALMTQGQFGRAIEAAGELIARIPASIFGHISLSRALEADGQGEAAYQVMSRLAPRLQGDLRFLLAYAELCRRVGREPEARRVLMLAQRGNPRQHRILLKIADLYRDDGATEVAHIYYESAAAIHQPYGLVRKLAFESDAGLHEDGLATFREILAHPAKDLLRFLSMLNRVSVCYPELHEQVQALRQDARSALWNQAFKDPTTFRSRLQIALACRWLRDVDDLLHYGAQRSLEPDAALRQRIQEVKSGLGPMKDLIEVAWHNEHEKDLLCLRGGSLQPYMEAPDQKTVEFFVPTAFFAHDDSEKPTYSTVRAMFSRCFEVLRERRDVVLVPRLQLNWRKCQPRLEHLVFSYHTHGEHDLRHLHVQESTLSGRCSVDHAGFAGFASIARDFAPIDALPEDAATHARTQRFLNESFVKKNVSKYQQTAPSDTIKGRYVFVAMQISTDIVAQLAHIDGLSLLRQTVRHFANSETKVVVKRHPYCRSIVVSEAIDELVQSGEIQMAQGSIHQLIRGADAVVTVNSGVGLEALMHEKPVIVTGDCEYAYAATQCRDAQELKAALDDIQHAPARTRRFLHYYWNQYTLDPANRESLAKRLDRWVCSEI